MIRIHIDGLPEARFETFAHAISYLIYRKELAEAPPEAPSKPVRPRDPEPEPYKSSVPDLSLGSGDSSWSGGGGSFGGGGASGGWDPPSSPAPDFSDVQSGGSSTSPGGDT